MVGIFNKIKNAYNWVKEKGKKTLMPVLGKIGDLVQNDIVQTVMKAGANYMGVDASVIDKITKGAKIASQARDSYNADPNKSIFDIVKEQAGNLGDLGIKGLNRNLISKMADNAKATTDTINNIQEKGFNKDTIMQSWNTFTDKLKSKMDDLKYTANKTYQGVKQNPIGAGLLKAANYLPPVAIGKGLISGFNKMNNKGALTKFATKTFNNLPPVAMTKGLIAGGKSLFTGYQTLKNKLTKRPEDLNDKIQLKPSVPASAPASSRWSMFTKKK
ncbi:hypothetical protein FACS189472_14690 [Alphaproteobacteria bacterium]|nr:hypothetical protein FACS189472_14690 [Alphaproteobacteria bacterium]